MVSLDDLVEAGEALADCMRKYERADSAYRAAGLALSGARKALEDAGMKWNTLFTEVFGARGDGK